MKLSTRIIHMDEASSIFIYTLIVILGYGIDLTCYVVLIHAGASYTFAYFLSFVVGATTNVILFRIFLNSRRHSLRNDVAATLLLNGAMIGLGYFLYIELIRTFQVQHIYSKIFTNTLTFALNYATRRLFF